MCHPDSARIMVIGTDMHFCYLMRRYVRESDHPLLFATLGEEALDLAQRERPALIVMEAGHPDSRSLQVVRSLKSNQATCQIPIVFCSWLDEDISNRETGADICLRMPVLYSDFLDVLYSLGI
jgi:CheY-like chemotaxis protein